MSKREIRDLLSRLLPYVNGQKQATALFTVILLLVLFGMTHAEFDAPHLHVESAQSDYRYSAGIVYNGS